MAKSGKAKGPPLEMALERGEKFFQKGNFPLAKRELETALDLGVSEAQAREIAEKLAVCAREIALLEGREAVKRARKLEKKGQHREALEQFEKALAIEHEVWIEERIAALRLALNQAEASDLLQAVAQDDDPQVRLAAYDKALAAGADPSAREERANCLVELERFDDAITQYATAPPSSDLSRYRLGYAYAAVGRYLDAIETWKNIETLPQGLAAQVEQLLPFACREAQALNGDGAKEGEARGTKDQTPSTDHLPAPNSKQTSADGYGVIIAMAQRIEPQEKSAKFHAWEEHAACRQLDDLWRQQRFEEMLPLLPPLGQPPHQAALALHAKVAFKLAERDPQKLESAIGLWLTAIHDDALLDTLAVHRVTPVPLDHQAMRERLVQRLGALVTDHAKEGSLAPRIQGIWRLEERLIRQLASLPVQGEPPAGYPCTPGFARRHGLAEGIFAFLDAQPHRLTKRPGQEPRTANPSPGSHPAADSLPPDPSSAPADLLELRACFGPTGEAMMRMEAGEEELALAAIPRGIDNDLVGYCRERIALACGIAKARRGEPRIKQHFLDALPLLQNEPKRVQEIVDLAYADKPSVFFEGLADALEALCARVDHPDLPEATAHVMGIKAVALMNRRVNLDVVRKLLERALAIFPASELAGATLADIEEYRLGDDIAKAFKRQNPVRAAQLTRTSSDPHNRDYFFNSIERWYQAALGMKPPARKALLTELRDSCRIVDENHPLMIEIATALNEPQTP